MQAICARVDFEWYSTKPFWNRGHPINQSVLSLVVRDTFSKAEIA